MYNYLDDRHIFIEQMGIALGNARKAFFKHKNIFYFSKLKEKVKILCYILLIRSILTYACQIWYGILPSTKEKLSKFVRECLRVCLRTYRSHDTNYERYVFNSILYDKAGIPRIDIFILRLIDNHNAKATRN